jgi:hypothetical protein
MSLECFTLTDLFVRSIRALAPEETPGFFGQHGFVVLIILKWVFPRQAATLVPKYDHMNSRIPIHNEVADV